MALEIRFQPGEQVEINVFTKVNDSVVTIDLGDDPETGYAYSLWCSLHSTVLPGRMEFAFWIAQYDPNDGDLTKIWDGRLTRKVITGATRIGVLGLIRAALLGLVQQHNPQCVFMQTMDADMPERALMKYYVLGEVLANLGYEFWRLSPFHGREAWLAQRKEL